MSQIIGFRCQYPASPFPHMKLHQTKVSISIKLAASTASGWADT
jgi:hypothetical protein